MYKKSLLGLWSRRRSSVLIGLLMTFVTVYVLLIRDRPSTFDVTDSKLTEDYKPPSFIPQDNEEISIFNDDDQNYETSNNGNEDSISSSSSHGNNNNDDDDDDDDDDNNTFLFTQHPAPKRLTPSDSETAYRQQRIVDAFRHAWKGYQQDAFGKDEYQPLSQSGHNWAPGGIGLMMTDAIDTMLLMNLTEEYAMTREWIATQLDFDKNQDVNVFETTIRVLGGLLSAYHLSGNDPVYLEKATDLGNRLLGAFQTESGIPYASVVLSTGLPFTFHVPSSTAEVTTIQLEFKYLSHVTGDPKYWDAAERVMLKMKQLVDEDYTLDGLVPILIQ